MINNKNINPENKISEILESFRIFDGIYKRDQIESTIELKDEITPHLLKILENLLLNPNEYIEKRDLFDHFYALMILGNFKEPKAHKLIIDIFSLPDKLPDLIFGDFCTSKLPILLFNTCNGSIDQIISMACNKKVYDFCRVSAFQALTYAVVAGYVPRKKVLKLFGTLFTGDEAEDRSDFWGLIANLVCDLYPDENMEIINQAYKDGLIKPELIDHEDFDDALRMGKERCLEKLEKNLERNRIDDLHESMSWWSCFDEMD